MNKYQAVLDAANALYKAMGDYEADLLKVPDANATHQALALAVTRAHIQKLLGVPPMVELVAAPVETQAVKTTTVEHWPAPKPGRPKGKR